MSRLLRDGTVEPVSRDELLRRECGQGNIHFLCSAHHEQDWQPYLVELCVTIPVGRSTTTEEFVHFTRENLQITFELARRNLSERVDKQKANSSRFL